LDPRLKQEYAKIFIVDEVDFLPNDLHYAVLEEYSMLQISARGPLPSGVIAILMISASVLAIDQQRGNEFKTTTTAITVDVVVRDDRGEPVYDLQLPDFELSEDGVSQRLGDVTLVADPSQIGSRAAAGNRADAAARTPVGSEDTPASNPTFVALVFDRLSPEARALAHQGALTYLERNRDHDFAGVFLSDLSLVTVQTYTSDRRRLRKALYDVASRATSTFDRLRIGPRAYGDPDPGTPPTAGVESEGTASLSDPAHTRTVDPGATAAMDLVAMTRRMERAFEVMSRDQQGHATVSSLLSVITGLAGLPGRKSVIFFAEALAIPPNVHPQFESVVATANRFNVSVYSVDAAGLRVHSGQAETARRVNSTGAQALDRNPDKPGEKYTEALEINEDVLRRDPAVSLRLLAERTGGFLINDTNDLTRGFRRIDEDRRFHYVLTYTPTKTDFRGEWRRITVRVRGRNFNIRARTGYLAVHAPGTLPLLAYEGPALAALDQSPLPTELPVRAGAFAFPEVGQPKRAGARIALLVAADGSALAAQADKKNDVGSAQFTILARIKTRPATSCEKQANLTS
jgi:VWFA-related protein